jgi:general secretion pathway protein G
MPHVSQCRGLCQHSSDLGVAPLADKHKPSTHPRGFSLIELLIVMAIIMTIAAIAVPNLQAALDDARMARAVGDIHAIETDIANYELQNGQFPNTLADIGRDTTLDPWGNPYQYFNYATGSGNGQMRLDRFSVPLNDDYELYSMGKDGLTASPITAPESQDDILRADDGSYLGFASQY